MKTKLWKRITSGFLAFIMIIVSLPYEGLTIAAAENTGIGVSNTVYRPDGDVTVNTYKLTFTNFNGTKISLSNDIAIDSTNGIYLNHDGVLEISGTQNVVLTDNQEFVDFLKRNQICRIDIDFQESQGSVVRPDFYLHEEPKKPSYDLTSCYTPIYNQVPVLDENGDPVLDENGEPVTEEKIVGYTWNDPSFEKYSLRSYTSSMITDFQVNVNWLDKDLSQRPKGEAALTYSDFTISRSVNSGEPEELGDGDYISLSNQQVNSNLDVYTYAVPMYDKNGNLYDYSVTGAKSDIANYSEPVCEDNNVTYTRVTDFVCNVDFSDAAYVKDYGLDVTNAARPHIDSTYVTENFELWYVPAGSETPVKVEIKPDNVVVDEGENDNQKILRVTGLDEMDETGNPINYYLKPVDTYVSSEVNSVKSSVADDDNAKNTMSQNDQENDYYELGMSNTGILFTEHDKIYSGGTMSFGLTGEDQFQVDIHWKDVAKADERKAAYDNGDSLGNFEVWRVLENDDSNWTNKIERIGSGSIDNKSVGDTEKKHYESTDDMNGVFTLDYDEEYIDSNGNKQTRKRTTVSKYGPDGYRYIYYADGGPNLPDHANSIDSTDPDNTLPNGLPSGVVPNHGSIISQLSGTKVLSLTAEWIAAARQGGSANLTYKLQKYDSVTGEWVDVTDDKDETVILPVGTFYAETMKLGGLFPEVDKYDENGNIYQYRIVQTSAERTDVITTGGSAETATNKDKISILMNEDGTVQTSTEEGKENRVLFDDGNGGSTDSILITMPYSGGTSDQYYVTATRRVDENGNEVIDFKYVLRNTMPMNIQKVWGGAISHIKDDPNASVTVNVKVYDYKTKKYVLADTLSNWDKNITLPVTLNNVIDWKTQITVDQFDEEGHELIYRVEEKDFSDVTDNSGKPIGKSDIETDELYKPEENLYQLTNIIGPGDKDDMEIQKIWVDDGELEYRNTVQVDFTNLLMKHGEEFYYLDKYEFINNQGNVTTSPLSLVKDQYYEREFDLPVTGEDGTGDHYRYQYNPANFKESIVGDTIKQYWYPEQLTGDLTELANGAKWIYAVKSTSHSSKITENNSYDLMTDPNYVTWLNKEFNFGKQFQYVYRNNGHYYAVCYDTNGWSENSDSSHPDTLTIYNYRIGVINYKVDFSWLVGDALKNNIITGVTLQIEGNGQTFTVPIDNVAELQSGKDFYILNLPKYETTYGTEIKYTLKEVAIKTSYKDEQGNPISYDITNGQCIIIGDDNRNDCCLVEVTTFDTEKNPNNSNSDDIIPVQIKNTFSSSRDFIVNKVWKDDHTTDGRSGLYLRLSRQSSKSGAAVQNGIASRWEDKKELDKWTFTYKNLIRYDEEGYEYTYWVTEVDTIAGYKSEYVNTDASDTAVIHIDDTTKAYNKGTIVNTRVGTVTQSGNKMWKNINSTLSNTLYPVAYVYLYAKYKGVTYTKQEHDDGYGYTLANYEDENIGKVIAVTAIYNGQNNYKFTTTKDSNTLKEFPMYDEEGQEITYTIAERAINGYSIVMNADGTLINEYHGDNTTRYKITKKWENKSEDTPYPSVKVTLHQAIKLNEGELLTAGTKINVGKNTERTLTEDTKVPEDEEWTIDYRTYVGYLRNGESEMLFENLATKDPRGNDFIYYVTESMENYEGEKTKELDLENSDSGMGYQATITPFTKESTAADSNPPYEATITNKYEPDISNFQTKLTVNKEWTINGSFQSQYKREFEFVLQRWTSRISVKNLFRISSGGQSLEKNETTGLYEIINNKAPQISITGSDKDPAFEIQAVEGYKDGDAPIFVKSEDGKTWTTKIAFTKSEYHFESPIEVTITVLLNDNGNYSVQIDGLAKYAQDGVRYTYKAVEDNLTAGFSQTNVDKSYAQIDKDNNTAELLLDNRMNYAGISISKMFGAILKQPATNDTPKESEVNSDDSSEPSQETPAISNTITQRLPKEDYAQFFDKTYINSLQFKISAKSGNSQYDYDITVSGASFAYPTEEQIAQGLDASAYYYYNTDNRTSFPTHDPAGASYQFTITETSGTLEGVKTYGSTNKADFDNTFNEEKFLSDDEKSVFIDRGGTAFFANAFPAKEISLQKKWNDLDNVDGMRPDILAVALEEKDSSNNDIIAVNKLLTNVSEWKKANVFVPSAYYYKSEPVAVSQIEITENINESIDTSDSARYKDLIENYQYSYGSLANAGYSQDNENGHDAKLVIRSNNDNEKELEIWNKKDRLNGTINIQKLWEDYENKWKERPDEIYVMIQRKLETESESESEFSTVTENYDKEPIGTNGVITISENDDWKKTIDKLPYGEITDSNKTKNGTFTKYIYKVVECDSNGTIYQNESTESFGYTWKQTITPQSQEDSSSQPEKKEESEFIPCSESEGQPVNKAALDSNVTNTLKETKHTVIKVWDDEKDYYGTRENYTLVLQRKTVDESEDEWEDVSYDGNPKQYVADVDELKQKRTGQEGAYSYPEDEFKLVPDTTSFNHLPARNKDGVEYQYRVMETYIGEHKVETIQGVTRTHNYKVEHTFDVDKNQTTITNSIITEEPLKSTITAKKVWSDEKNQDGQRTSVTFTLTQKIGEEIKETFSETVDYNENDDISWQYIWENFPIYDNEGHKYIYSVDEGEVSNYSKTITEDDDTYSYTFTNTYTPKKKNITVTKTWDDQDDLFKLRPEKIKLVLYCKYDDGNGNKYEGAVSEAPDLLKNQIAVKDREHILMESDNNSYTFSDLPVRINPTGTETEYGKSVDITYWVVEEVPDTGSTGYDYTNFKDFSDFKVNNVYTYPYEPNSNGESDEVTLNGGSGNTLTPENRTVNLGNKLNTRDIIVAKSYDDQSYMNGASDKDTVLNDMHYNTKVTLGSDTLMNLTSRQVDGKYSESKVIANTVGNGVKFTDLPIYDNKGAIINYYVKEEYVSDTTVTDEQIANAYNNKDIVVDKGDNELFRQGDTRYGYDGSCQKEETTVDGKSYVTQYNILDTLPLTAVTVVKTWDDQNDIFSLRPDSITLSLEEKAVNTDTLSTITPSTISDWTTPQYSIHDTGENQFPVKSDNTWTYTYKKLLKYNADNQPYIFKITETAVKAYQAPEYTKQYITAVLPEDTTTDGTNPLTEKFAITNTLDTRDIIVVKHWEDNGYLSASDLHYDIAITLSNDSLICSAANRNVSGKYNETKILSKDDSENGRALVFKGLPKYDSNGNIITYTVKESLPTGTDYTVASGDSISSEKVTAADVSATEFIVPTNSDRKYGYIGTCTKVVNDNIVTQYDITNTLPLTAVQAVKYWDDQSDVFGIRPASINLELTTRKNGDTGAWETPKSVTPTGNDPVKDSTNNTWTYTYTKLLKYSEDNQLYHFRIEEKFASGETHINGYKVPKYCKADENNDSRQTVTNVENNGNKNWDGTNPLTEQLAVKNTLDTRDITVTKTWVDNGYPSASNLHYDIDVTLDSSTLTCSTEGKNDGTFSKLYKETQTITVSGNSVTFQNLPKYDKNGDVIVYNVREDAKAGNDPKETDKTSDMTKANSSDILTPAKFTDGDRHYNYVGSAVYTATHDGSLTGKPYLTRVDITNTLPLVSFTAQKKWEDENNRDYLRAATVTFTLQRRTDSSQPWEDVSSLTARYDEDESKCWKVNFGKQLEYSTENKQYEYQVIEGEILGYTGNSATLTSQILIDEDLPNLGEITNTDYTFTNTHEVAERQLTVTKIWNDNEYNYKDTLRPTNLNDIEVELWCIYKDKNGEWVDEKVDSDNRVRDHINAKVNNYDYDPELNIFSAGDYQREYTFRNLPVYINVDDDAVSAPSAVEKKQAVYYYVKETFHSTSNGHIYSADYSNDNSTYYDTPGGKSSGTEWTDLTGTKLLSDSSTPNNQTIYVRNTPKKRDILVTKTWEDYGYGDSEIDTGMTDLSKNLHYNTALKLDSESVSYTETKYLAKADSEEGYGVIFKDVPIYAKDGSVITYKVTEWKDTVNTAEPRANLGRITDDKWSGYTKSPSIFESEFVQRIINTGDRSYGYVGSAEKYTATDNLNKSYAMIYAVTDTLPLTAVTAVKTWEDQNNEFDLRPSGINDVNRNTIVSDKLNFTLSREVDSDTDWTVLQPNTSSEYTHWYQTTADTTKGINEWTYTYQKLLKCDVNNNDYSYKLKEEKLTAYLEPVYVKDTVAISADDDNLIWNGLNALTEKFAVTNTLHTRDITVTKTWEDNGYSDDNIHYDIDMTLYSEQSNNGAYNDENLLAPNDSTSGTVTRNNNNKYQETKTIETSGQQQVVFYKLPIYDKDGKVIVYNVREDAHAGNSTKATDKSSEMAKADSSDALTDIPTFTDGDRHFGYVGSAVYVSAKDNDTNKVYATQYDITNTLPLTKIKVNKDYVVDETYHKYVGEHDRDITVELTRTAQNDSDTSFSQSENISYKSTDMTTTFDKLLVYNYNNAQYTYQVTEAALQGYTTTYSTTDGKIPAEVKESTDDPQELTITNTQITGDLLTRKIDDNYYERFHESNGYIDKPINDVFFELYIKDSSGNPIYVPLTQLEDRSYKYDITQTLEGSHIVKSQSIIMNDENIAGAIKITGLPLNTYYLKEYKDATHDPPSNYIFNEQEYSFTVDVATPEIKTPTTEYDAPFLSDGDNQAIQNRISNEENIKSTQIKLTKTDKENGDVLKGATYYLLMLIPKELSKVGNKYSTNKEYITAATEAIHTSDGTFENNVNQFWYKANQGTTDSNGEIGPLDAVIFNTYAFLEVQAPIGYAIDNSTVTIVEVNEEAHLYEVTHEDPRKDAKVKVFKQDEFENPLNGAIFQLFYQPDDTDTAPVKLAEIVTGDDGLPNMITWLKPAPKEEVEYNPENPETYQANTVDTEYLANVIEDLNNKSVTDVRVVKWGTYYWVENTSPTGYTADNQELEPFTISAEQADKTVNIVKANNTRIKGKITLMKLAKQKAGNTNIGDVIQSATFKLYRADDDKEVKLSFKDEEDKRIYLPNENGTNSPITDENGQFVIEELDWGSYYLKEVSAPDNSGYKHTITDTNGNEQENRVYFTVGRNNCEIMQQLTCKDEAQTAKLKITKNIDDRVDAWGTPTFIFKIKNTKQYIKGTLTEIPENERRERIVSLTIESGLTSSTDYIEIDPGAYEITEVNVSRYDYKSCIMKNDTNVTNWSVDNTGKSSFVINADGQIEVQYDNTLAYYDKFSHVDVEVNRFHGYKGIRVEYNQDVLVTNDPAVINKEDLAVYKILSNGREERITDINELNKLTFTYVEQSKDDSRFGKDTEHDFSDDTQNNCIRITNPTRYTDSVYQLQASYDGFTDIFEIRFVAKDHTPKVYEKTIIFKADSDNHSYFNDESNTDVNNRTAQYIFTFTIAEDNGNRTVYSVKHNGHVIAEISGIETAVNDALATMQSAFTVNEAYNQVFDKWLQDGTEHESIHYSYLETLAKSETPDTVTFTAVLKDNTQ